MSTLNLLDIINLSGLPVDDVVVIRHSFNKKENKDIWDPYDRRFFEEYQSLQPVDKGDFFKNKKYVLSFVADGKTLSRFVGCFEILKKYPASEAKRIPDFPHQEFYSIPSLYYYEMKKAAYLEDMVDRLVIDWGKGTIGYVQYKKETLVGKQVVSIEPDFKHSFPGYNRVIWSFSELTEYLDKDKYEEIYKALSTVYAVYLVTDTKTGKYYVGSAYGKDGLFGRWLTYAKSEGRGGDSNNDQSGNIGIVQYLNEKPKAYLDFQYSILEVIHKTGIDEKDIENTLEAEKVWKKKLCSLNTEWGLNRN